MTRRTSRGRVICTTHATPSAIEHLLKTQEKWRANTNSKVVIRDARTGRGDVYPNRDKAKKFAVKLNLLNGAYNGRDAECSCGIPEVQHVLCEHCVGMTTRLKINPASLVFKEDRT